MLSTVIAISTACTVQLPHCRIWQCLQHVRVSIRKKSFVLQILYTMPRPNCTLLAQRARRPIYRRPRQRPVLQEPPPPLPSPSTTGSFAASTPASSTQPIWPAIEQVHRTQSSGRSLCLVLACLRILANQKPSFRLVNFSIKIPAMQGSTCLSSLPSALSTLPHPVTALPGGAAGRLGFPAERSTSCLTY